jgi:hypothetical protein
MSHINTLIVSRTHYDNIIDLHTTTEYSVLINIEYLKSFIDSLPSGMSAIELTNRISTWSNKILRLDIKDLDHNIILSTVLEEEDH